MNIRTIKTKTIFAGSTSTEKLLGRYVQSLSERSILVLTSKVIALCENRVVPIDEILKNELIINEAEYYLPPLRKKDMILSIKGGRLIPMSGIDESNGNGNYVLWPADPYESAREIRKYLMWRFKVHNVGVVITDSTTSPLRLGTTGIAIGTAGFEPLKSYIGKSDLFGRELKVTRAQYSDAFAAAAVAVMGEGGERTPIAVITDLPFVRFTNRRITAKDTYIDPRKDIYGQLLTKFRR